MTGSSAPECEIIYVGDPMCSWCWGFAPVAHALRDRFGPDIGLRMVMGGLRPGNFAAPLDADLKRTIRPHWERVEQMTGQPFDYSLFERDDFLYDTEPACRAVVCARRLDPTRAFDVFVALQHAFYAEGRDITQTDVIAAIVAGQGIDPQAFRAGFAAEDTAHMTYADFALASRLGAHGFPTVFLQKGEDVALLTMGYQSSDSLVPATERFFKSDSGAPPAPARHAPA